MNLVDMKPKQSKLKLKALKQELILNPITLADEAWLDEQYGAKVLSEIFTNVNIKEISRIVYRLLDADSKKLFKKQVVELVNEDGESEDIELGGVQLLMTMVIGWEEKLAMVNALLDNIGMSRPDEKPVKKKKQERETVEMKL